MSLSVEQFVEKLDAIGLLSAAEVSKVTDNLPSDLQPADVPSLAKLLIREGKLTKYQATAVYQEKTKHLVMGPYVVIDLIGAGGMGQVLKAVHRTMDREVALKILPPAKVNSADAIKRFHQEVRAAAKLLHPNIVAAHDAGEYADWHSDLADTSRLGLGVQEVDAVFDYVRLRMLNGEAEILDPARKSVEIKHQAPAPQPNRPAEGQRQATGAEYRSIRIRTAQ